jgi:hypothetical protein
MRPTCRISWIMGGTRGDWLANPGARWGSRMAATPYPGRCIWMIFRRCWRGGRTGTGEADWLNRRRRRTRFFTIHFRRQRIRRCGHCRSFKSPSAVGGWATVRAGHVFAQHHAAGDVVAGRVFVGVGHATGEKEETTIAANTLELIDEPLRADWLARVRRSTSAEPLVKRSYRQLRLSPESYARLEAILSSIPGDAGGHAAGLSQTLRRDFPVHFRRIGPCHAGRLRFPAWVYPIGRLDADSEGLLLLSDEPALNRRLLHPRPAASA